MPRADHLNISCAGLPGVAHGEPRLPGDMSRGEGEETNVGDDAHDTVGLKSRSVSK